MKLIHVSDPHTHHDDENNVELQKRADALRSIWKPGDRIIFTGDISDDGRADQREKFRKMFEDFSLIVEPGNHDYGLIGSEYSEEDAKGFDEFALKYNCGPFKDKGETPDVIEIENILIILVNSCLETENIFDFACGEVGGRQRRRLRKILDDPENKEFVKVVALHHDPWNPDPTMKLFDSTEFLQAIFGKVDVLMYGHSHEERYRHNSGCREVLGAGALFESEWVKTVEIEGRKISVKRVKLF